MKKNNNISILKYSNIDLEIVFTSINLLIHISNELNAKHKMHFDLYIPCKYLTIFENSYPYLNICASPDI